MREEYESTKRLCRMLESRGIEYVSIAGITTWTQPSGYTTEYVELADSSDTRLTVWRATPEQALATFGARSWDE